MELVKDGEAEQPAPQMVGPAPLPEVWTIGGAMIGPSPAVVIQVSGPHGINIHFLDRDVALKVAGDIRRQAQSGPQLVTPPAGLVVPR